MSDIRSHSGRDPSCFGSCDWPLTKLFDRRSHNSVMLLLGKRQLALISSGMRMASLLPILITQCDSISLITDILEVRRNPPNLRLRMQEAATRFALSPTDKTLCLMFGC